ncbi:hypothetical protein GGS23DRAFT_539082 [Durotheca rogersii]|uniref:uncharacterized protein n=1 Tax=Durotheca rogersii TaxID=419775 RepID=UPI00221E48B0|nr:uncharacterized protein GGS23DRAFT_539082 [Durotheca rogersii]KAI5863543.1 hypothetical protein GGS23DRAFT_539082 [Durotheca rogersii]
MMPRSPVRLPSRLKRPCRNPQIGVNRLCRSKRRCSYAHTPKDSSSRPCDSGAIESKEHKSMAIARALPCPSAPHVVDEISRPANPPAYLRLSGFKSQRPLVVLFDTGTRNLPLYTAFIHSSIRPVANPSIHTDGSRFGLPCGTTKPDTSLRIEPRLRRKIKNKNTQGRAGPRWTRHESSTAASKQRIDQRLHGISGSSGISSPRGRRPIVIEKGSNACSPAGCDGLRACISTRTPSLPPGVCRHVPASLE